MTALRGKAPAPPVAVEKKIDEAAVKVSADQAAWQALGETVRQQIISLVVKEQRLYARTQADFTLLCYAEMRRRGLGPADEREREREREREVKREAPDSATGVGSPGGLRAGREVLPGLD